MSQIDVAYICAHQSENSAQTKKHKWYTTLSSRTIFGFQKNAARDSEIVSSAKKR